MNDGISVHISTDTVRRRERAQIECQPIPGPGTGPAGAERSGYGVFSPLARRSARTSSWVAGGSKVPGWPCATVRSDPPEHLEDAARTGSAAQERRRQSAPGRPYPVNLSCAHKRRCWPVGRSISGPTRAGRRPARGPGEVKWSSVSIPSRRAVPGAEQRHRRAFAVAVTVNTRQRRLIAIRIY